MPAPNGGTSVTGAKTVSSGFLPDNNPNFTVSFPKTGTYQVQCLVHPNMKGTVTVVPKGSSAVTTPAQLKVNVLKAKRSQRQAINQQIVKTRKAPANVVTISPGTNQGEAFGFFPANRSVPVGTAVTFKMAGRNEFHTVSFGPAAFLQAVGKTTFSGQRPHGRRRGLVPDQPARAGPARGDPDGERERLRQQRRAARSG